MRVALIDPSSQVPYYTRALAAGLEAAGVVPTIVAAPQLYYEVRLPPREVAPQPGTGPAASGVEVRQVFGRLIDHPWVRRLELAHRPNLRRLLRGLGYGPELVGLFRWLGQERPDVVHLQWSLAPVFDAHWLSRVRAAGMPIVYTAHNSLPHELRWWHRPTYAHLYRRLDRVVVHSRFAKARLERLGVDAGVVSVVPMAAQEPERLPSRAEARATLELPQEAKIVLFFGQVRQYKGLDVLLEAMAQLVRAVPEARLVVAGAVAGGERGIGAVSAAADSLGLQHLVDLRLGYVPHEFVTDYFSAADVVALPYVATDSSAVLETARGHHRAVVASAVGGIPEALGAAVDSLGRAPDEEAMAEDGLLVGGGLLVKAGDADALARAVGRVLREPGLRHEMENDMEASARRWTWSDVGRVTARVYESAWRATAEVVGSGA